MRFHRQINILVTSLTLLVPVSFTASQVQAATFTSSEISQVHQIQNEYAALPKLAYSQANLYSVAPHLTEPFSAGKLSDNYINSQLAYINYYRRLFGLTSISANSTDNDNAQITASVMAAIKANPFTNQHGLPGESRPSFISDMYWTIARNVSAGSNLNFNVSNQSAGDVITDLLTDRYNLDGADTGHRAWLLSTRLTTTGIGAAYGVNGYRYSVQQVAYPSDSFKAASKASVTYPSSGVFPIELLQGGNVAWSVYLSDQIITSNPQIMITDLDTGQKVTATNVHNYSSKGYGNFVSVITYSPGNLNLISGHQYMVDIAGITTYTFKLFNEIAANQVSLQTESQRQNNTQSVTSSTDIPAADTTNSSQVSTETKDVKIKSALLLQAEKLRDSLKANRLTNPLLFGRSYQDGRSYYNLGPDQWIRSFYTVENPDLSAGVIDISDTAIDTNIYSSPYLRLQKPTISKISKGQSYAYGQTITIGKDRWYYLGPHMWIHQQVSKKSAQKY